MTQSARTGGPATEPHAPTEARPPQRSEAGTPIAIIGMACRFPGADGIGAFWRLLEAGGSAVQEGVPGSGVGCVGALFPDDTGQIDACRLGAYLDEIDQFDAAFFRISPVDAVLPGNVIAAVMVPSPCCRWSGMAGMPSPGNPPPHPAHGPTLPLGGAQRGVGERCEGLSFRKTAAMAEGAMLSGGPPHCHRRACSTRSREDRTESECRSGGIAD